MNERDKRLFSNEQLMSFEVSSTRHYGAASVTLTMGGSFVVTGPEDTDRVYDVLAYKLQVQHDRYAKHFLHDDTLAARNDTPRQSGDKSGEMLIPVEEIKPDKQNGKPMAKVLGGRFRKFGIPCYPEHWKLIVDEHPELMNGGEYEPGTWAARVQMNGDKPRRVLNVARVPKGDE